MNEETIKPVAPVAPVKEDRPVESEIIEKTVETHTEKKKEYNRMCLVCGGQKTPRTILLWPFMPKYCECEK